MNFVLKNLSMNLNGNIFLTKLKYSNSLSSFNKITKFNFNQTGSKEELSKIKESLKDEEKSIFNKLSEKFSPKNLLNPKLQIINHTNKEIDLNNDLKTPNNQALKEEEYSRDKFNIKNLRKTKDEDMKTVDEIYRYQSGKLSKKNYSIEAIEIFLEKIKKLGNINLFIEDKRFNVLVSDFLFIINDSPTAKELFHMTLLSFIFDYYGNLNEFHEKLYNKLLNNLRVSEILDVLLVLKYFKKINKEAFVREGSQFLITEVSVRLDPNVHKRNKNILIENDELVQILVSLHEFKNLEESIIQTINKYIEENLDAFSLSELIEISLFYIHYPQYQPLFLKFFKNVIYEKKLRRNMKNLSADKLYNISFILYKLNMFDLISKNTNNNTTSGNNQHSFDNFRTILETLLKNDSLNADIEEYLIIKNSNPDFIYDMTNLIIKILEEAKIELNSLEKYLDERMKTLIELLFNVTFHYFLANQKRLTVEQTFNLVYILDKKKLLEKKILNDVYLGLCENISTMDYKNLAKFLHFTLTSETELKATKKLKNNLINIFMKSDDAKIINEIILYFTRTKDQEFLNLSNLDFIFKKFSESIFTKIDDIEPKNESVEDFLISKDNKKLDFELAGKIKILWNISNFMEIFNLNFNKIDEKIRFYQKENNKKLSNLNDLIMDEDMNTLRNNINNFISLFNQSIKLLIRIKSEEMAKFNAFDISLIFHSIKNFSKLRQNYSFLIESLKKSIESLNNENTINLLCEVKVINKAYEDIVELLKTLDHTILSKIKELGKIEFLLVFSTYCENNCISEDLVDLCFEIVINSLDQYSLYELDLITYCIDNINFKNIEVIGVINRMKIILTRKILQKSVEDIDVNIIKESINELIAEEAQRKANNIQNNENYKKLI